MKCLKEWLKGQLVLFFLTFILPIIILIFAMLVRVYFPDYTLSATAIFIVALYAFLFWCARKN